MTDDTQEGALPADETQELVTPEVLEEEAEVQQPSGGEAGITEARLIEILNERAETQARKDQSAKDRAISRNAKDIADILDRFEAGGSDKAAFIAEADQQASLEETQAWQTGIESKLATMATANTRQTWQDEWDVDSQKILDAAEAEDGVTLSNEEVNAGFLGQKFESRGDAYVLLNALIASKRSGKPASIPASAVSTEGGEVARTPKPVVVVPQTFRQEFDKAEAEGDEATMQELIDTRYDELDKDAEIEKARRTLERSGISAEDLLE